MSVAWLWGVLLVGATVLLAVAGTVLARRWVSVEILKLNNEVAGFIYGVIGVLYAVLLGFTAIIVWEQFEKAQAGVDQEKRTQLPTCTAIPKPFPTTPGESWKLCFAPTPSSWWNRNGRRGRTVVKS